MFYMQAQQKPLSRQFIAVIRLLVLVAVASAVLLLLLGETGVDADAPTAAPVEYRVEPGDSLWEIAEPHTAPGGDVRETVRHLLELNGLDGADLRPGQVLLVPATS